MWLIPISLYFISYGSNVECSILISQNFVQSHKYWFLFHWILILNIKMLTADLINISCFSGYNHTIIEHHMGYIIMPWHANGFPNYWPFVMRIHQSPVDFPKQKLLMWNFDYFLKKMSRFRWFVIPWGSFNVILMKTQICLETHKRQYWRIFSHTGPCYDATGLYFTEVCSLRIKLELNLREVCS